MPQVIVYLQDNGRAAVLYPAADAVQVLGIHAIARKDVPAGEPYKIADASEIPADRSARDAWTVLEADLTDGVGADFGVGSANQVVGWFADGTPLLRAEG